MKYTHKYSLLFAALIFYLFTAFDRRSQSVEYAIKSAMILKIAQNIEWENLDSQKQFTIAVVGKSQFGDELQKATERMTIHNLPVRIEYAKELKMQSTPQLIFICKSEKKLLNDHVPLLKNERDVLIMADSPEFSGKGVHINFYTKTGGSIHFELDMRAFNSSDLKPSLQLINISKIIR